MRASDILLDVNDLVAGYRRTEVLHGVSLKIRRGEFVTILGANGAGKSTLIKALVGLVPARGSAALAGRQLLALETHRRVEAGIAYVPEGRRVFPALTVAENLQVANRKQRRGAVEEIYRVFPRLAERSKQLAGTMSGGEQQMLALGRALIGQPALLLADEISLGLAPLVVESLFEVLARLNRDGMAILLAEQNTREALGHADTAYVLETGRITLSGPASEMIADPRVIDAYLQAS
jgi:branched-chain amino acid transport system ATP-binding protein